MTTLFISAFFQGITLLQDSVFNSFKAKSQIVSLDTSIDVQSDACGHIIPLVYGTAKVQGYVIWSLPIDKELNEKSQYNYYVTCAIAIAQGPVKSVLKIWANDLVFDIEKYTHTIYYGDEIQEVDSLIASYEPMTPAFRGLVYIVFEKLPLAEFNNTIPKFSFIVNAGPVDDLERMVNGINIIPGTGEFVYDTSIIRKTPGYYDHDAWINSGISEKVNQHCNYEDTDIVVSLQQMQDTFPNIQWVSVVVSWFIDSLDVSTCNIYPAVEYKDAVTHPKYWQVAQYTRENAKVVTKNSQGRVIYGGTINDLSLVEYIDLLHMKGYKVLVTFFLLVDDIDKPWRGHIEGDINGIENFNNQYNNFILHYANLIGQRVEAFIIGSELEAYTNLRDHNGVYHGITNLVYLAGLVREIIGDDILISYAANWTEYNKPQMDILWSNENINIVSIDAYFPLTDIPQPLHGFTVDELIEWWDKGEGYDYFYINSNDKKDKIFYESPIYAVKNIEYWWNNLHYDDKKQETSWVPKSKNIWFTEYGFASVDNCTSQPHVFFTANKPEFPYYSVGKVDVLAQRNAIIATLRRWLESDVVTNFFLWCWDARPFPSFPQLHNVWMDGSDWKYGHWVQGKVYGVSLSYIVYDICLRAGLLEEQILSTALSDIVMGYIIDKPINSRQALQNLQNVYFFNILEKDKKICALYDQESVISLHTECIVGDSIRRETQHMNHLPPSIELLFLNYERHCEWDIEYICKNNNGKKNTINIPVVMYEEQASAIANILFNKLCYERISYNFSTYSDVEIIPGDIISLYDELLSKIVHIKVEKTRQGKVREVFGVLYIPEIYSYFFSRYSIDISQETTVNVKPGDTFLNILDIPSLPTSSQDILYFVIIAQDNDWRGMTLYNNGLFLCDTKQLSVIGKSNYVLRKGFSECIDTVSEIIITLIYGTLTSLTDEDFLNFGNLSMIGKEIIQFQYAEQISNNQYKLKNILRGCCGTEHYMDTHEENEDFILLDANVIKLETQKSDIETVQQYSTQSIGSDNMLHFNILYTNYSRRPFSVAHLKVIYNSFNDEYIVSWVRRSRIHYVWSDYTDIPLDEQYEKYYLEIIFKDIIKRGEYIHNSNQFIYTQEMQKNDTIGTGLLVFRVYQVSDIVGLGVVNEVSYNVYI
ncbi:MAG: hypothetical protein P857_627 [Candidatus Xenolissoclinum pacificiensis L6]|uniref:GTA TIM-barrel-like domain-containing protein n=1 Tax=Candidatus Xenolissoclinum pacificiensis L6 TaxID=1401685 RepID=W2UYE3_9RICK|nr:MAG: hypothetical protein P857_627 [Candidatus Xenolissoclinum pacificiensis L6]